MAEAANLEVPGGGGSDANSLILTASSSFSSTLSSSDLDTDSITSFFPERGITLGSLIGIARDVSAMADGDPSSLLHSTGANHANCHAGRMAFSSVGSTASSQGISCSHMSRIRDNAKLWSLLPCGTCIYANNKGISKGFCCANKGNSCVVSSATGPLSSSLRHFLVAERDADRDAERLSNEAKVYINIMYEEGQRVEEAAVNPLFDLDSSTPANVGFREMRSPAPLCTQSPGMLEEAGVMLSLCTDNETCTVQAAKVAKAARCRPMWRWCLAVHHRYLRRSRKDQMCASLAVSPTCGPDADFKGCCGSGIFSCFQNPGQYMSNVHLYGRWSPNSGNILVAAFSSIGCPI